LKIDEASRIFLPPVPPPAFKQGLVPSVP